MPLPPLADRTTQTLRRSRARRIALAAQGFADPPHAQPTMRTLRRTVARTGVLQIDSVNVLQRAHYLPLYSRMGPYDTELLTQASGRAPRDLVEYWAHVAAFMPVDLWPVMRHRMRRFGDRHRASLLAQPTLLRQVRDGLRDLGPVTARDLDDGAPREKVNWGWNWSKTKDVLEYLFSSGEVAVAGRNSAFERLYDLPERVLPRAVLDAPVPAKADADIELIRRAARSHGIGTVRCLADYYRMRVDASRTAISALVEGGELLPVKVEGWTDTAYLWAAAARPRRIEARTLLSPFDPMVWERARTEALFDFHYRIEIYTPAAKRRYGYYVLPFLLGERLVARVDLKADRATGRLLVHGAYAEESAPAETAEELAAELGRMAGWLGLGDIVVTRHGDLAEPLAALVSGTA
ncbi:MAG: winged helix-turn-helix domain-containing protein [Nocardioides sp.]